MIFYHKYTIKNLRLNDLVFMCSPFIQESKPVYKVCCLTILVMMNMPTCKFVYFADTKSRQGGGIIPDEERRNKWKDFLKRMLTLLRIRISAVVYPLVKNHIYTTRHGLAKGLKRKGGLGFIPQITQLTQEDKFLMNLDLSGQNIYDIGGAHGLFTLFFAQAVGKKGKVVTFEPNPELHKKIIENVKLNKFNNVEVRQIALGKKREKATLAFLSLAPGSGSLEENITAWILQSKDSKTVEVDIDSLDHQIATGRSPKPDFIKIDVQGVELDVLLGMSKTIREYLPKLFVEIHGGYTRWKAQNLQNIVEFLIANGYSIYHVESGEMINLHNAHIVEENEHLYCMQAA